MAMARMTNGGGGGRSTAVNVEGVIEGQKVREPMYIDYYAAAASNGDDDGFPAEKRESACSRRDA